VAEQSGIPGVVVTNPGFDEQVRNLAQDHGISSIQVALYPDPFDLETNVQLREKSENIVLPQIISALTKPIHVSKGVVEKRDGS